jgi:Tfp pilus assembly protein PilF
VRMKATTIVGLLAVIAWAAGCGEQPAKPAAKAAGAAAAAGPVEPPPPPEAPVAAATPAKPPPLGPELTALARAIGAGQTEAARQQLEAYLRRHPDDGRAAFLIGLSYHREKRYAQARPYFEQAIKLSPEYHPTYHFLGWCLYYLGDTAGAHDAFETHLVWLPSEGDSHFGLGLCDLDEDRLDDAEAEFRRAIELQAGDPRSQKDVSKAHARLADVYLRRDDPVTARAELETATRLWPQHYTAFYKLSRVLNRLGETEAAEEAYRQYKYWEGQVGERRGIPEDPE